MARARLTHTRITKMVESAGVKQMEKHFCECLGKTRVSFVCFVLFPVGSCCFTDISFTLLKQRLVL